jgi:Reverse transcriptase (RNA-dependent DNA polymerase)
VELDQALYGCIESAVLWYKELSTFLDSIGFTPNPYDRCILNKKHLDGQTTIAVYVDDLLITSSTQAQAEAVLDALRDKYKELKVTTVTVHNYLRMVLGFSDPPYVSINQIGRVHNQEGKREPLTEDPKGKPKVPGHGAPVRGITRQPSTH